MRANSLVTPGHGMFIYEAEIMALFDARVSEAEIARATGYKPSRVRNVIRTYQEGQADMWQKPARLASMRLADAIAAL